MIGRLPLLPLALVGVLACPLRAQDGAATEPDEAGIPVDTTDWSFRGPLASRNQMPLSLLFVYLTPEGARTLERGDTALALRFDYSNIIANEESENERVHLDTEYLRLDLDFRRGFGGGLELGASMPFFTYYGGFLDPFVDGFHRTFGFPNYLRGETSHGISDVEYLRGDDVLLRQQGSFGGAGDLSLHVKKKLFDRGRAALSARAILKLPTGSLERLTGSGAADAGFGLAYQRLGDRFGLFGNFNYHLLGKPERLPAKNYLSFMVGADWRFKPTLSALLQVSHERPPLEGEVKMLSRGSWQLAVGLRWRYSERFVYEWRFVEDLRGFGPDFTAAFDVGVRFPRATASGAP